MASDPPADPQALLRSPAYVRLVVLAMQDRLAYAPTFEEALAGLFGTAPSATGGTRTPATTTTPAPGAPPPADISTLIAEAARDLADYQRLTAEGKLGEAGQKLEHLKRTLEALNARKK